MSIETSTRTVRDRTRVTAGGATVEQVTIPGTDREITRTQAAIGAGAALLVLLLVLRGGTPNVPDVGRGFLIRDV